MQDLKDTLQVGIANGSAIGVSLVEANEMLTLVSLILAISFTIYKFIKYEKKICNIIYRLTGQQYCFKWCEKDCANNS